MNNKTTQNEQNAKNEAAISQLLFCEKFIVANVESCAMPFSRREPRHLPLPQGYGKKERNGQRQRLHWVSGLPSDLIWLGHGLIILV